MSYVATGISFGDIGKQIANVQKRAMAKLVSAPNPQAPKSFDVPDESGFQAMVRQVPPIAWVAVAAGLGWFLWKSER